MRGTGGNGAAAGHVAIRELGLGGLRVLGASLPVAPLPSVPRLSPPVAGLLGGDILAGFEVEVALPDQRLTLREAGGACLLTQPAGGMAASRSGNRLIVEVALEGQTLRALVDTGARSILLSTAAATRLGVTAGMLATDPGGLTSGVDLQPTEFHWHRFASLRIGDELQRAVTLTVAPLDEDADMLLGAPFFAAHRVILSYAAGVVAVERVR